MLLDALMTLVANGGSRGKVHDGTPGRDCTYQQDTDEDAEGEEMEAEDEGRHDARERQNPNEDREREWRGGGRVEQHGTKAAQSFRKRDMPKIMTERPWQYPSEKESD